MKKIPLTIFLLLSFVLFAAEQDSSESGNYTTFFSDKLLQYDATIIPIPEEGARFLAALEQEGVGEDYFCKALSYSKKGINAPAAVVVSRLLYQSNDYEAARKLLDSMINSGSPFAMVVKADHMGADGPFSGSACDAMSLYQAATAIGFPPGRSKLGMMYVSGGCGDARLEDGISMLIESVKDGDPYAAHMLGALLVSGEIVEIDTERGIAYLERAIEMGSIAAKVTLAKYLAVTDRSAYSKVYDLLLDALKHGDPNAGHLLVRHLTVWHESTQEQRLEVAELMKKLSDVKDPDVQYALGVIHDRENFGSVNFEQAFAHYLLAHSMGNSAASIKIAEFLYRGKGVDRNREKALEILTNLRNEGDETAEKILGRLSADSIDN